MYYSRSTNNQNFIQSFSTIDFRLSSRNLSQYPSICHYNNELQADSLAYTESQIDQMNSMRFLQQPLTSLNNFPQSFMNIDIDFVNKPEKVWHQQQQSQIKNPQNTDQTLEKKKSRQAKNISFIKKQRTVQQNKNQPFGIQNKNKQMDRKKSIQNNTPKLMNQKKSILMINNLQLNFYDNNNSTNNHSYITDYNKNKRKSLFQNNNTSAKYDQKQSKINNPSIHVKSNISSGKLSILSRSHKSSISSQSTAINNLLSPPTSQESIGSSILMGSPYSHKTQPHDGTQINPSSLIKKRCFSQQRRPKSSHPISSSEDSSLFCILKNKNYQSLIRQLQRKTKDRNNLSALSIDNHIHQNSIKNPTKSTKRIDKNKIPKTQQKMKQNRRKNFLEDSVPLNQIINVKQIKLEQNSHVEKNYLRKIIQNRVTIHHFNEHGSQRQD